MVRDRAPGRPDFERDVLTRDVRRIEQQKGDANRQAAATATGGAGGGGSVFYGFENAELIAYGVVGLAVALTIVLVLRAQHHEDRKVAYKQKLAEV